MKGCLSVERPTGHQCESKIDVRCLLILFSVPQLRAGLFKFIAVRRALFAALLILTLGLGMTLRPTPGSELCYTSDVSHPAQIFKFIHNFS